MNYLQQRNWEVRRASKQVKEQTVGCLVFYSSQNFGDFDSEEVIQVCVLYIFKLYVTELSISFERFCALRIGCVLIELTLHQHDNSRR